MPEVTLWTGHASQVKNLKSFCLCGLAFALLLAARVAIPKYIQDAQPWFYNTVFLLVLIPIAVAAWKWLQVRARKFQLTNERLLISGGVINVATDSLELYRVKDIRMAQPLFLRFFGLENIQLTTSDLSSRLVQIDHVPKSAKIGDVIRAQVEICRVAKGTREVEMQ